MERVMWKCVWMVVLMVWTRASRAYMETAACEVGAAPEQVHLSYTDDEHEMRVMWITRTDVASLAHYAHGHCDAIADMWSASRAENFTYGHFQGIIHSAILPNIQPNTMYCYSIGTGPSCTRSFTFKTPSTTYLSFAVIADTGTWGEVNNVISGILADNQLSMLIHAGDLSYATNDSVWDTWGHLIEPVSMLMPYMIIPGNWDIKPFAVEAYLKRYMMPLVDPSDTTTFSYYYSFNKSLVHFVMLSSYDPYDSESPQYKWLERDLQAAHKDRKAHPWIVVSFHSPMYSSSVGHGGSDLKFRAAVELLLCKYHVDLAFSGHDHGYERTYPVFNDQPITATTHYYVNPTATIHILAGTGGATADEWLARPASTAHRESSYGHTRVVATRSKLHVVFVRTDTTFGDEFWIIKEDNSPSMYAIILLVFIIFVGLPLLLFHRTVRRTYEYFFGNPSPSVPEGSQSPSTIFKLV